MIIEVKYEEVVGILASQEIVFLSLPPPPPQTLKKGEDFGFFNHTFYC